MTTISAVSLAGPQTVHTGTNTNATSSGHGYVTITLSVAEGKFRRKEGNIHMNHAIAQKDGKRGQFFSPKEKGSPHMQEPHQIDKEAMTQTILVSSPQVM
ncbi:hypothetical protein HPG69_009692 [Diceros bicornis minor]|uniref:Uncharacterized protein n=1 Tax=Diceros bicornis minor TaxID=77932 RepID=A0A7J7EXM6_DICBM|nr:hypothetical protein HPG69_009692 [Diceros bicornis minor]